MNETRSSCLSLAIRPLYSFLSGFIVASLMIISWAPCLTCNALAQEDSSVRLAYGRKIHYAPQIIAVRQGYFKSESFRVAPKIVLAGSQSAEALITAAADAAAMGDVPAVFAAASGRPLRIIACYGFSEHMHRIVAASGSGIRDSSSLRGKRVAIQFGSSTYGAFLLFCRREKIKVEDIRLINLRPTDMPEAMQSGQIDAVVGSEPWPSNIEAHCPGSYGVTSLAGLGNKYPLMMLVTEKLAAKHPDRVAALLRAVKRAIDLINRDPEAAAKIIAKVTGAPVSRELKVLRSLNWELCMDDSIEKSLTQTAAFLNQEGKIAPGADIRKKIDRGFIPMALSHSSP